MGNRVGDLDSDPSKKTSKIVRVLLFICYFFSSIFLILYQKNVLKHYPYPISIVLCHLITKFLFAWIIRYFLAYFFKRKAVVLSWCKYQSQLSIVGITSAFDIAFSNWAIEIITVSLYTITKTTSTPFILLFSLVFKLEKPSFWLINSVGLIFTGLLMFTYRATSFNFIGFFMALIASLLSGIRWTYTQVIMQKKVNLGLSNPVDMIYHVQPIMIVVLVFFSAAFEGSTIAASVHGFRFHSYADISQTILYIVCGGTLAFFMEISEYFVVFSSSSLTLAITGVTKDMVLILGGIYFYSDSLTVLQTAGLIVCLFGIIAHIVRKNSSSSTSSVQNSHSLRRVDDSGTAVSFGDKIPLLSDSDLSDDNDELSMPSQKMSTFKEMDDEFIINNERRVWDSVKNSQLNSLHTSNTSDIFQEVEQVLENFLLSD